MDDLIQHEISRERKTPPKSAFIHQVSVSIKQMVKSFFSVPRLNADGLGRAL